MTISIDPETSRRLTLMLHLAQRARDSATGAELGFVAVNESFGLVAYRQAALWIEGKGVVALSSVPQVETGAPFVQWLDRVARQCWSERLAGPIVHGAIRDEDAADWAEWLPPHAAFLPLGRRDEAPGALVVAREEDFGQDELAVLDHLAGAYGHAWRALHRPNPFQAARMRVTALASRRRKWLAALAVVLAILPVRLSVLAPAEMVPARPLLVRAPLDGVVETIHVRPNDLVAEGQPLFDLDATTLRSRLEVAEKALAGAEAEYRQSVQAAVWDPKAKAQLAIIAGRIEEKRAEAEYMRGQLDRTKVIAPAAGIVVFDDPSSWLGRPVTLGEKVMAVTGETDTEVEAWLAVGDTIPLAEGAPVTVFLNSAPLSPVDASLRILGYEAQVRPDGSLAYRLRAAIDEGETRPRVGLKGTARIDGDRVPLAYWLFRKPVAAVRQWLGM